MFVADTHVHLYPCYDPEAALRHALANLRALVTGQPKPVTFGVFLTERAGCHCFRDWHGGAVRLPDGGRLRCEPTPEENAIVARDGARDGALYIFAGRQIATRERLEVLALTSDADIPDGLEIGDTVRRVLDAGGVPVLPWALGKWFFKRGRLVRDSLRRFPTGRVLIGDTALRPRGWPAPRLMRNAQAGCSLVAGTDPLPFPGEERRIGTYATAWNADLDPAQPVTAARRLLMDRIVPMGTVGRREGPVSVLVRRCALSRSK